MRKKISMFLKKLQGSDFIISACQRKFMYSVSKTKNSILSVVTLPIMPIQLNTVTHMPTGNNITPGGERNEQGQCKVAKIREAFL